MLSRKGGALRARWRQARRRESVLRFADASGLSQPHRFRHDVMRAPLAGRTDEHAEQVGDGAQHLDAALTALARSSEQLGLGEALELLAGHDAVVHAEASAAAAHAALADLPDLGADVMSMLVSQDEPIMQRDILDQQTDLALQSDPQCGGRSTHPVVDVVGQRDLVHERFRFQRREITVRVSDVPEGVQALEWMTEALSGLLGRLAQEMDIEPHDRVGLTINQANQLGTRGVALSFRRFDQITADVILAKLERVIQSNELFLLGGPIDLVIQKLGMPTGRGRNRQRGETLRSWAKRKARSVVLINNGDDLCLSRAIVVGYAYVMDDKRAHLIARSVLGEQETRARALCTLAGVSQTRPGTLDDCARIQGVLPDVSLVVFADRHGKEVLFRGPAGRPRVYILHSEGHFCSILSCTGAFAYSYFCAVCLTGYSTRGHHACAGYCMQCRAPQQHAWLEDISCPECHRVFNSAECLAFHRDNKLFSKDRTLCEVLKRCVECDTVYSLRDRKQAQQQEQEHVCGEVFCSSCRQMREPGHLCYMQVDQPEEKKMRKRFAFVFYDFETAQHQDLDGREGLKEHVPVLLVSQTVCAACLSVSADDACCEICGPRTQVFEGENLIQRFFEYLRGLADRRIQEVVAVAHNGKGYDHHFLLRHMIEELQWSPQVLCSGQKILTMEAEHITFKDSLNFLQMPLRRFGETFNLEEGDKGYFPHFFTRPEHDEYEGPLPDEEFFGPETMSEQGYREFAAWHAARRSEGYVFKFGAEMHKYCKQDVSILRRGVLAFREACLEATTVDPLRECPTLASLCMKTYRRLFLEEDTIGLIPPLGYRAADVHSQESLEWLAWRQHLLDTAAAPGAKAPQIQHAENGREVKILTYRVDGVYADAGGHRVVLEYHGCLFHGCPDCYPNRGACAYGSPHDDMGVRYENTLRKRRKLERAGCTVIEMWGCAWAREKREQPAVRAFLAGRHRPPPPLDPRAAFYGGRTNALVSRSTSNGVHSAIRYYDFTSLYPHCNKNKVYVKGHPDILLGKNIPTDLTSLHGLVRAQVLPPRRLYHPVLPVKLNKKLLFPLCYSCAASANQDECLHTDAERALEGTWVSYELQRALERGYRILSVDEVWSYPLTTKFDKESRSGGLFAGYINMFLKGKTEASGWPAECNTAALQEEFVKTFLDAEGIQLNSKNMKKNPGMRALFKLLLNSFWGKLGQRNDLHRVEFFSSYAKQVELLTTPGIKVVDILPVGSQLMTTYKPSQATAPGLRNANVVLAAVTTCHARLQLLDALEVLGKRALYFDTDSVIFKTIPREPALITTGNFLGDFTDELPSPRHFISALFCGGCKNYAYEVRSQDDPSYCKTVIKVRGLTINHGSAKRITLPALSAMLDGTLSAQVITTPRAIVRVRPFRLATCQTTKTWNVCLTKRRRIGETATVPFGYDLENNEELDA